MRRLTGGFTVVLSAALLGSFTGCGGSASRAHVPVFTQLAFISTRTVSPSTALFLMTLNGSTVTPVPFSSTSVYSPSVSADLKTIAFESSGNV